MLKGVVLQTFLRGQVVYDGGFDGLTPIGELI